MIGTLADRLRCSEAKGASKIGVLSTKAKFSISTDIAMALAYLHGGATKIVHKDLKPDNILLDDPGPNPRAKLADFGLSSIKRSEDTQTGQHGGTAVYMVSAQF